jgi:hypothetical protein
MTGRFDFVRVNGSEKSRGEGRLLLAAIDGAEVPGGRLQVHLGPRRIGGQYARVELELGGGSRRFLQALFNDGPYPGQNWVEVFDLDLPPALQGQDGWEARLAPYLGPVGAAIPPGGHLMVEYDKDLWRTTQSGLLAGIPPLATPLGALLFAVGCGDSFKDWYFPEGGQEGGPKLQGNKALTTDQALETARKRATELRSFLAAPPRGDPATDARARADATGILAELRRRIG